ncbi:MFS transporter, partial [Candidatus Bathyarchaeota archaeon]|nr:MFS transporter [Candidatus Bathyarchaeota archaeon]
MSKSKLPFKSPVFYGWVIVAVSSLVMFFSGPGQTYSVSVFIDSYINEYGWSRSVVSSMYSVGTFSAGMLMG